MSAALFEVWDVSEWEVHSDETEGQEEKWWLIDPATNEIWLFKPPVVKNGVRQGEDWAERVSTELAGAIRIPCAQVQLGVRDGRRGSMARSEATRMGNAIGPTAFSGVRPELPDQTQGQTWPFASADQCCAPRY
jgi:hypothetical protein